MSDLISRQAAIDAADRADYTGLTVEDVKKVTDEVAKEIKKLPSAEPERKKGRWINKNDSEKYQCSECGITMWFLKNLDIKPDTYIFCPHCGAEMKGEENDGLD